jgi:hypothetical protein
VEISIPDKNCDVLNVITIRLCCARAWRKAVRLLEEAEIFKNEK